MLDPDSHAAQDLVKRVQIQDEKLADANMRAALNRAEINRLRTALTEIVSWKNDTLGARPKERSEYDCPPEQTEAFDRGCRMAFYRCAARAEEALKSTT